jgi:hypothetical protein
MPAPRPEANFNFVHLAQKQTAKFEMTDAVARQKVEKIMEPQRGVVRERQNERERRREM